MGHYCGECENYIPLPGVARGRCKIKQFMKTRKGEEKEFLPVRMRPACKTDFVLSADGFRPVIITCKYCGKEIEKTTTKKQEFCPGGECYTKWYQEEGKRKRRQEHGEKYKCQMCGKPLEVHQKKYCSDCSGKKHKPIEKKPAEKKRNVLSISEINRRALAEHLSYGEYVMKYGL